MKWTLITVSAIGAVTYAVIFFTQVQYDNGEQLAVAADAPVETEIVDRAFDDTTLPTKDFSDTVATLDTADVSDPMSDTPVEAAPLWEGDAWPAGVKAFENGDFELAQAALEVAVQEKETAPYRHYLLGLTYRKVGEAESAVAELTRSLELAPSQKRALVHLGRAYLDLDETSAAREAVDAALDVDLEYADAWQVLGRIELAEGSFEQAAAAFAKATDRDPQHAWAWNNLGYARIQLERFEEAVAPLKQALATGREEAVFYNNLGVALERTGREDLATVAFARAALLGHGPAEASFDRLETILVARGETVPSFDEIEALDAMSVAALVPDEDPVELQRSEDEVEVALDDPSESFDSRDFEEFHENREPIDQR